MLILGFFEIIRISIVLDIHQYPLKKLRNFKMNKKKKLIDINSPPRKCAYQAFIIQNLDVVTLELGMKVQFANF
jgi:hypothetical protein